MKRRIQQIIDTRGIQEIVHFTTSRGLLGVLASNALKSRNHLKKDDYIEHILQLVTKKEYDPDWKDYVNLSISRINLTLFGISSQYWYRSESWRILAFDPVILTHPGVYFVTTNNAYSEHLIRGKGPDTLELLFGAQVRSRYGTVVARPAGELPCNTTDIQAEVLYPQSVSTKYLRRVYVETEHDEAEISAQLQGTAHPKIEVVVDPSKFAR